MAKRDPVSEYLAQIGSKGGSAKVPKGTAMLSAEEMKERAKAMAAARWANKPAAKKAAKKAAKPLNK